MKKIVLIALVAIAAHAACQNDTITLSYPFYYPEIVMPPIGHYTMFDSTSGYNYDYCCSGFCTGQSTMANAYWTFDLVQSYIGHRKIADRPLKVIGLAGCALKWHPYPNSDTVQQVYHYANSKISIDRATGDSVVSIASVPIYFSMENISKRLMLEDGCFNGEIYERWVFEGFFDTALTIQQGDTFYLSFTGKRNHDSQKVYEDIMVPLQERHTPYMDHSIRHWPTSTYRMKATSGWEDIEYNAIPLIWLIIQRDEDTCSVPQLYAERLSENAAFVRWNNNANHAAAEFSFGPAGIAPEDGTIFQTSLPQRVFGSLDPDSHYTVYARARCDFARSEWTDWSAPLDIHLASMNNFNIAERPTMSVAPNPSSGKVHISCSHTIQTVTLFSTDGTAVLTMHPNSSEAILDLRQLPRGAYSVTSETAAGSAVKTLIVE